MSWKHQCYRIERLDVRPKNVVFTWTMKTSSLNCFAMSAAVCASASAVQAANHYPDPVFLTKRGINVGQVLSPPPVAGSPEAQADFARILDYQASRSLTDVAR